MSRLSTRARETTGAVIRLTIFAVIAVVTTLVVVSTIRPFSDGGHRYSALFASASRLAPGDQVRVAGVVSGRIEKVAVTPDGKADVTFSLAHDLALTDGSRAQIKYLDMVGGRYLVLTPGPGKELADEGTLPVSQTQPALDLSTLFNGFKPLFAALSPADVNALSSDIVQTLQGEGPTMVELLQHTSSLTRNLANRDEVIGRVVSNLDSVLAGLDQRQTQLEGLVVQLRRFVGGLSADRTAIAGSLDGINQLTETTAGLLEDARPALARDVVRLRQLAEILNKSGNRKLIDHTLSTVPDKLARIIRTASYGSWFNYYLCNLRVRVTDADPQDGLEGLLGNTVVSMTGADSSKRCEER